MDPNRAISLHHITRIFSTADRPCRQPRSVFFLFGAILEYVTPTCGTRCRGSHKWAPQWDSRDLQVGLTICGAHWTHYTWDLLLFINYINMDPTMDPNTHNCIPSYLGLTKPIICKTHYSVFKQKSITISCSYLNYFEFVPLNEMKFEWSNTIIYNYFSLLCFGHTFHLFCLAYHILKTSKGMQILM